MDNQQRHSRAIGLNLLFEGKEVKMRRHTIGGCSYCYLTSVEQKVFYCLDQVTPLYLPQLLTPINRTHMAWTVTAFAFLCNVAHHYCWPTMTQALSWTLENIKIIVIWSLFSKGSQSSRGDRQVV